MNATPLTPAVAALLEASIALAVQTSSFTPKQDLITDAAIRTRDLVRDVCGNDDDLQSLGAVLAALALSAGGPDAEKKHTVYLDGISRVANDIFGGGRHG